MTFDYRPFETHMWQISSDFAESSATLHLTANENILSNAAKSMLSCAIHGRYHLGHANKREYRRAGVSALGLMTASLPAMHNLELAACSAASQLFSASYVDLRAISGLHAMIVTISALTNKDDTVYCLHPSQGGHFATTSIIERLGRRVSYLAWDETHLDFDLDHIQRAFRTTPPDLIYVDHSSCLFQLNLRELRQVAGEDAIVVYDASHPLGLIAGGAFPNPLHFGCDVLQGNTHKTFPGPQKAIIFSNNNTVFQRISDTMDIMVSSQHSGDTLALYVTMLEMKYFGADYSAQILRNSKMLSSCLQNAGLNVINLDGKCTDTHQLYIQGFESNEHLSGTEDLLQCGLSVNAKRSMNTNVIRLGVQESTRRGLVEEHMAAIGKIIAKCLLNKDASSSLRPAVKAIVDQFSSVRYSFDNHDPNLS